MTDKQSPGFVNAIGNTPLIRLQGVSELSGCDIFGKAEFMNPGGSVKDRAAKAIIDDAESRGLLGPGGLIVEGTAGNTGIGIRCLITWRQCPWNYSKIFTKPGSR